MGYGSARATGSAGLNSSGMQSRPPTRALSAGPCTAIFQSHITVHLESMPLLRTAKIVKRFECRPIARVRQLGLSDHRYNMSDPVQAQQRLAMRELDAWAASQAPLFTCRAMQAVKPIADCLSAHHVARQPFAIIRLGGVKRGDR